MLVDEEDKGTLPIWEGAYATRAIIINESGLYALTKRSARMLLRRSMMSSAWKKYKGEIFPSCQESTNCLMEPAWEKINGRKFALVKYKDSNLSSRQESTNCLMVARMGKITGRKFALSNNKGCVGANLCWHREPWFSLTAACVKLEAAEVTGKQHKNVMRDIRKMEPRGKKSTGWNFSSLNTMTPKASHAPATPSPKRSACMWPRRSTTSPACEKSLREIFHSVTTSTQPVVHCPATPSPKPSACMLLRSSMTRHVRASVRRQGRGTGAWVMPICKNQLKCM